MVERLVEMFLQWSGPAELRSAGPAQPVAEGLGFTEGPLWRPRQRDWIFSDIPRSAMWRWSPSGGLCEWRSSSNKANGNALDREGRVITCEHATSRVVREEPDGTRTILAQDFEGRRLNSPNDVIVASDGSVLFTDPRYGLTEDFGEQRDQELDFQGVYRVGAGGITLLDHDFLEPNGLCLSPDEAVLYVNDSERGDIRSYRVGPEWGLEPNGVFARPEGEGAGVPDGMKCDRHGNVWCTGPGGLWVFDPHGNVLGRLEMPVVAVNLAFGGEAGDELLITAGGTVLLQRMAAPLAIPGEEEGR